MSTRSRGVSFNRNAAAGGGPAFDIPGLKHGPNGTVLVSSGIADLDKILGGGFVLGSLVMVMEDAEAPHHMLLLRNFMAQGLVNNQQLLYASPSKQPRGFLGTLPSPSSSSRDDKSQSNEPEQDKNLRIAWQYKKYFGEQQNFDTHRDTKHEYCNEFDLRKPVERRFLSSQQIECFSLQELPDFYCLQDRCASFLGQFSRDSGGISFGGRIAIQSFCAPQCQHSNMEWAVLFFIQSLKSMIRSSNAVAFVTFPPTLSPSFCKRLQHMSDTLLSVKAIPDEDKELESLLTGYQDMVGLLNIHKVARFNTQVPVILEASTFSIKLRKRRYLTLECLNQAPVDGSSGSSYGNSGSCSGSSKTGSLDF